MQHANYAPEDVFWGQLGGCLEALDAGTTTVVDHAHVIVSPAHSMYPAAINYKLLIASSFKRGRGDGIIRDSVCVLLRTHYACQNLQAGPYPGWWPVR